MLLLLIEREREREVGERLVESTEKSKKNDDIEWNERAQLHTNDVSKRWVFCEKVRWRSFASNAACTMCNTSHVKAICIQAFLAIFIKLIDWRKKSERVFIAYTYTYVFENAVWMNTVGYCGTNVMHFGTINACASRHWKPKQDKFNKEEHHMRCLSIGHPVKHELFFHSHATLFLSLSIRLTKNATNIFKYPFNVIHIFTGNKLVNRIKKNKHRANLCESNKTATKADRVILVSKIKRHFITANYFNDYFDFVRSRKYSWNE